MDKTQARISGDREGKIKREGGGGGWQQGKELTYGCATGGFDFSGEVLKIGLVLIEGDVCGGFLVVVAKLWEEEEIVSESFIVFSFPSSVVCAHAASSAVPLVYSCF